jgi:hypothetical protein
LTNDEIMEANFLAHTTPRIGRLRSGRWVLFTSTGKPFAIQDSFAALFVSYTRLPPPAPLTFTQLTHPTLTTMELDL